MKAPLCEICDRPTDGVYKYCHKHLEAKEAEVAAGRGGHLDEWLDAQKEEHKRAEEERKRAAAAAGEVARLSLTERMLGFSNLADDTAAMTFIPAIAEEVTRRLLERRVAFVVAAFICWASGGAIKKEDA